MQLAGRVALITGGGRGIGAAIATGYARQRAAVILVARSTGEVEATAGAIRGAGGRALAMTGDVTRVDDVRRVVEGALQDFGRVDILVNNAGIPGPLGLLHEIDDDAWADTLATNVTSIFLVCRAVLPHMIERRAGNIVNVSSGAGVKQPGRERVRSLPYQVSKFAVEGLTDALAVQMRPFGINVNSLLPGQIRTRFHDHTPERYLTGRVGVPEDVVPAAVYLAALAPGELTGQALNAREFRGGQTAAAAGDIEGERR